MEYGRSVPYVERDGARIWWEPDGDGPPVLLVMGLGYPGSMWFRVRPFLADAYRTIVLDNRGVGATGVPPGPYTIEQMADDAVAVLDASGAASAHIVGASMGGLVVQELALRDPGRVRSLVLACTFPGGRETVPPDPAATRMLAARAGMSPREAAYVARPFIYAPGTPDEVVEHDIEVRMRQPTTPLGYSNQLQAVVSHRGTFERIPQISAPTLVVHGTLDKLVDPANAPVLAGRVPGARLAMVEGASHLLFSDRTEEVGALLRSFLDEVSTAR